jgi:hypothetical protein
MTSNTSYYSKGTTNKCFGTFTRNQTAGDYIYNKKAKATFCVPNINHSCVSIKNANSDNHLLLFKRANTLNSQSALSTINKTELYINLITTMDLSGIPLIQDISGNIVPAPIYPSTNTNFIYLKYNIDPCGNLFGAGPCGEVSQYKNYMMYNI